MNQKPIQIEENEIDIKEVFRTIYRYRYMIIFLVLLFGLVSSYHAYFKPNIYQASATVEVGLGQYGSKDMLSMATESGSQNTDTEMQIIRSRSLTEKALKDVDFSHRYYTTRKYKEVELYKESPFKVGMLKGYGISFNFFPVDDNSYRLSVEEAKDANGTIWSYNKILAYNEEIDTKHFHLNIVKTKEAQDVQYRFVIMDPENMAGHARGGVSVTQISPYSTILQISYSDNVPLRAQEFTNAISVAYIDQSIERKTKVATYKLAFIDKQLKRITENLENSAIKVEDFKRTSKTVDLSSKADALIQRIGDYETRLTEITIEEEMLNTLYKRIKSGQSLLTVSIAGLGMTGSSIAMMLGELQKAINKKKRLRADYTEMYPEVRKLSKMIVQYKANIIATIKNMRVSIKDKKLLIERSIEEQQKLLNKLPTDERMFGELQRKFVVNEKIYSYLLEQRLATAVVKASTVSKNRIIDRALLPGGPIQPKRKMIVLVGLVLGLILGIALAFLRAFLDDRIKEEEDLTKRTDVPLFGIIPYVKQDNEKLKVFLSPKSSISEAFRNLRTNLQFMSRKNASHVIAVTSTVGGEGKTTICMNLSGIMSMANKKTILINLDMRKPTLHERFGINNRLGMSTLLSGNTDLKSVIQHTEYENLDVITSGPVPPNPSELIQSEIMEKLLLKLKEVYDVIILDTPPVGLVTDARILMHLADTNIYVLRANYSKRGFLRNVEKLAKEDIRGFGMLLNDVKMGKGGYGYGSGYGYYEEEGK